MIMRNLPGKNSGLNAYDLLLSAIEAGELPPGSRLREVELANRFGISRTPVREALKKLEAQGLVMHEPHHGAIVAQLDYSAITELYAMREVLEGTAARLAAIHSTDVEIEVLKDLARQDRLVMHDPQLLARNNRKFHAQIHQSARNRYLLGMFQNMRTSLSILAGTTLAAPGRSHNALEEHEALISAIEGRDPEAADKAACEHIRRAFRARLELLLNEQVPAPDDSAESC
jgi:DNA-binding GntR family transcriptional regulator